MEIIDSISAYTIEIGDQIIIDGELVQVDSVEDDENEVCVKGYSHSTGDVAYYALPLDATVDIWAV